MKEDMRPLGQEQRSLILTAISGVRISGYFFPCQFLKSQFPQSDRKGPGNTSTAISGSITEQELQA